MSIWATSLDFSADDHAEDCARWVLLPGAPDHSHHRPGELWAIGADERGNRVVHRLDETIACTCRCGPIRHRGSHILPSDKDERAGSLWFDHIPGFITREGRDDGPEDEATWWPYLRVGLAEDANGQMVVLDRKQVLSAFHFLGDWLMGAHDPDAKGKAAS